MIGFCHLIGEDGVYRCPYLSRCCGKGCVMRMLWIGFLLLVACSSCRFTLSERKSGMLGGTWTFENSTLGQAIEDVRDHEEWGRAYSFKVRNDRTFERLVFKGVVKPVDLTRAIEAAVECEILEAGRWVVILLPRLE